MNRKFSASMEFQRPGGGVPYPRQPRCPVCRAPVEIFTVYSDGQISDQPRCRSHGDVAPVYDSPGFAQSINAATTIPGNVWDGEGP